MKQLIKYLIVPVLAGVMFTACSDDDAEPQDTTAPVISEAEVHNHAHGGKIGDGDHDEKVMAGEEGEVHFKLSDDRELGSWKVDIHDAFDGHSHGKVFSKYSTILSGNVSGTSQEVEVDLGEIPADATSGEYHCIINATDAAGNSADFAEVIFILSNGTEPELTITSPDFEGSSHVHMDKGSNVSFEGTLTDDTGIEKLEIFITEEHDHDHDHDHGKTLEEDVVLFDKDDFAAGVTSFDLSDLGSATIPADMEEGDFILKFVSEDADGNYMIEKFEIHIE
jgi:hypothetical protein